MQLQHLANDDNTRVIFRLLRLIYDVQREAVWFDTRKILATREAAGMFSGRDTTAAEGLILATFVVAAQLGLGVVGLSVNISGVKKVWYVKAVERNTAYSPLNVLGSLGITNADLGHYRQIVTELATTARPVPAAPSFAAPADPEAALVQLAASRHLATVDPRGEVSGDRSVRPRVSG